MKRFLHTESVILYILVQSFHLRMEFRNVSLESHPFRMQLRFNLPQFLFQEVLQWFLQVSDPIRVGLQLRSQLRIFLKLYLNLNLIFIEFSPIAMNACTVYNELAHFHIQWILNNKAMYITRMKEGWGENIVHTYSSYKTKRLKV